MQAYENGRRRIIDGGINKINTSFSLALMDAIAYYHDFRLHGQEMLITFSEEEERMICDESRKLLNNHYAASKDGDELQEKMLFAKALKAMISTILVNSLETLILCNYVEVVVGNSKERRIGILYHAFLPERSGDAGTSFSITPIEMTMTV